MFIFFLTEQFWKQNTNYFFTFSETTYKKFVGTVQVQAQNLHKEIDVSFKSKCADDFVSETSVCKNIPYGESVDFTASIILDRCMNKSLQFEISPIGIGQVSPLQNENSPIMDLIIKMGVCYCHLSKQRGPSKMSNFENSSWKNQVPQTGFLTCKNQFRS